MKGETVVICRLCLKPCENNFEAVEGTAKMLDILLPQIDLSVSEKPCICSTCVENVKHCYEFKSACLCTEDYIRSSTSGNMKVDLKQVYLNKCNKYSKIPEDHSVCRLCMELGESGCFVYLNDEAKDVVSTQIILGAYFPELDLDIGNDPAVCTSCYVSLQSYARFLKNCSDVEEKIKEHCEIEVTCKNQVRLNNVSQFTSIANTFVCGSKENSKPALKYEHFVEEKVEELDVKQEELNIKTDDSDFTRVEEDCRFSSPQTEEESSDLKDYKCKICAYSTKLKYSLVRHMLVHKDASEVRMYQCETCEYKTKHKNCLTRHNLIHSSKPILHQCDVCVYKTKYADNLKKHLLIHEDASITTVHQCEECPYKGKSRYALRRHMLTHNASEVAWYECKICDYKTRYRYYLKKHALIHKDASEVKMYQCEICPFTSKFNYLLKRHMLVHKSASEVTLYSCDMCEYKTKHRVCITTHVLKHKHASEVTMFQCAMCDHKTKYKYSLKQHMLVHISAAERTVYRCDACKYKAKTMGSLRRHKLSHKISPKN